MVFQYVKRKRKWILVLPAAMLVLAGIGVVIQKATRTNEILKQQLLVRIRPFLDQGTDIRKLDFSLSNLHLRGVKLAPKNRTFLLEIDDLKIGYSLWNVIRYGFDPNKIAYEIVLQHPVFTLKKQQPAQEDSSRRNGRDTFRKTIDAFGSIQRFTVSNGDLRLENDIGQHVLLAHQLDGHLWTQPPDSGDLRLAGYLFDSKKQNLRLNGKINLLTGALVRLAAGIDESELSQEIPLLVPGFMAIRSGRIKAALQLDPDRGVKGIFELRNGFFSLKKAPMQFDGVELIGSIADSNLVFHGTVQRFNGSHLSISGKMRNWLRPRFDVSVSCPRLNLNSFITHMSPTAGSAVSGEAMMNLRLSGVAQNPTLDGRFFSDRFQLYGVSVNRLESRFSLRDSVLTLNGSTSPDEPLGVLMQGRMDLTDDRKMTQLAIALKGDFRSGAPGWLQKRVETLTGNLEGRFDGAFDKIAGSVQGKLAVFPKGNPQTVLYPELIYLNKQFAIALRSNQDFKMDGNVSNFFQNDIQWNITAEGAQWLLDFLPETGLDRCGKDLQIQLVFNGSQKEWFLETKCIRSRKPSTKTLEGKLVSKTGWKNRKEFSLKANYFGPAGDALPVEAQWILTPNSMTVRQCEIGSWIYAQGQIPRSDSEGLKADIRIDNLVFEKLHSVFPGLKPFVGRINGRIQFSGTRGKPLSRVEASLDKGNFNGVNGFEGEMNCDWTGKIFRSGDIEIRKNNIPLLVGHFAPSKGDSVTGKIQSGNLQFSELTQAWTGRKNMFNGEGAFEFGIHGSGLAPLVSGRIRIRNGSVKTMTFSDFSADITDTLQDQTGLAGGICQIRNGILVRDDGLNVEFWGDIPHGKTKTGDFSVMAKGNILGVLTEADPFFKKASGIGELFMKFAGERGAWTPSTGWIKLEKGQLELSSIVKKIEKLQLDARLVEGSPFLQITRCSGQVGSGLFSVNNDQARGVKPFVLPVVGIDLGVLYFTSQGRGIPVHIPGLMEPGDEGWIAFSGLNRGESFMITGPVSSFGLVGTLFLNDNRVTFPFLDTGGSGSGSDFLDRIHWNLRVVPRNDVHYIRNIGSPFGNVYLDLQLQNGNGELRFEGVIQDSTFNVWGRLVSTDGSIEVLDRYFKPERITFDYPKGAYTMKTDSTSLSFLSGRAYTTLTDSTGARTTVWMNLVTPNRITGYEEKGGMLEKVQFKFSTDNPNLGRTEADLLAALGYSTKEIKNRAYDAVGMQVDNYFFRPIFGPIERSMRRYLGLDMVRFSSMFGRNLIQLRELQPMGFDPRWLLRSTKLTVGKYLAPGLVLTYSGEIQNEYGYWLHTDGIGLKHSLTLEYSIRPDLFLEMEYLYDNRLLMQRREDARIWLRHVFPF